VGVVPHAVNARAVAAVESSPPAPRSAPADLAPDEARVFGLLTIEPRHVDELATAAGLATNATLAALLGLELRDLAESLPGKQFRLR
jgi:DNA processing protein